MDKRWISLNPNMEKANNLANELNILPILAQILLNRGITTKEEGRKFLFPHYNDLYNPFLLKDMEKAIERILEAIKNKEKIFIYGDYDVDGVTSTTLLNLFFRETDADINYFIPLRFDGYGLNKDAIKSIKEQGGQLIISVDCGISAIKEVDYVNELGMEIIITDHHKVHMDDKTQEQVLPNAYAVINPKRTDSEYPFKELAGVGVAYKLATALQHKLNVPKFSKDLRELLDIVAFGSVADLVPLKDENRTIVKFGLDILNNKENVRTGMKELIQVSGLWDKKITTTSIGFQLAPRINALGRLKNVREAVEMFLTTDTDFAIDVAKQLDEENKERQKIQEEIQIEVLKALPPPEEYKDRVIVLGDEKWHTGIKGIVASKVLELYYRPVILCTFDEGVAHGSARSIEGFDIAEALDKCKDILISHGGHSMAAGMAFKVEDINNFKTMLNDIAIEVMTEEDLIPKVKYDLSISIKDITFELINQLENLEPFGMANPKPYFNLENTTVVETKAVGTGEKHLQLKVQESGHIIQGIAFNLGQNAKQYTENNITLDIVCSLGINEWQGRQKLQIEVKDIKSNQKVKYVLQEVINSRKTKEENLDLKDIRNKYAKLSKKELLQSIKHTILKGSKYTEKQLQSIIFNDNNENNLIIMNNYNEKLETSLTLSLLEVFSNNKKVLLIYPTEQIAYSEYNTIRNLLKDFGVNSYHLNSLNKNISETDIIISNTDFLVKNIEILQQINKETSLTLINEDNYTNNNYSSINKILLSLENIKYSIFTNNCNDNYYEQLINDLKINKVIIEPKKIDLNTKEYRNSDKIKLIKEIINNKDLSIIYVFNTKNAIKLLEMLNIEIPSINENIMIYNQNLNDIYKMQIEKLINNNKISVVITSDRINNISREIKNIIYYDIPNDYYDFNKKSIYKTKEPTNIYLLYNKEKEDILRDDLGKIYSYVKHITTNGNNEVTIDITTLVNTIYENQNLIEQHIDTIMNIFAELKLMKSTRIDNAFKVSFIPTTEKINLSISKIYQEYLNELLYSNSKKWLLDSTTELLSKSISSPVYPVKITNN